MQILLKFERTPLLDLWKLEGVIGPAWSYDYSFPPSAFPLHLSTRERLRHRSEWGRSLRCSWALRQCFSALMTAIKERWVYERWCPGGRARLKWSASLLPSSAWTSLSSRRGSHGPRKVNQTGKLHKLWKKTRLVLRDCLRWLCLRQLNLDCSHWRYWIIVPLLAQRDLIPTCFLFSQQI